MLTISATSLGMYPSKHRIRDVEIDILMRIHRNHAWTEALEWPGQTDFNKAEMKDLKTDGKKTGTVKSSGNLTFMSIHAAGHMVPMDQPEASLDFFNRWLGGEWF